MSKFEEFSAGFADVFDVRTKAPLPKEGQPIPAGYGLLEGLPLAFKDGVAGAYVFERFIPLAN